MDNLPLYGALAALAAALVYAFWPKGQGATTLLSSTPTVQSTARNPGRQMIDHYEEAGKDAAGREISLALGKQKAAEIARSMAAAFASAAPPAVAAPTPPPNPNG